MESSNLLLGSQDASLATAIQAIINRSYIIDYGIIKEIPTKGIVVVEVSAAKDTNDVIVITCVLAGLTSENLTVDVDPKIGDKVIVFYTRRFADDMFNPDESEPILGEYITGYDMFSGIAFLANQYKINHYKNVIKATENGVQALLSYDKKSKKNNIDIATDNDGTITIKNPKATVTINANGDIETKNDKVTISFNNSGSININNKVATVNISNTGNVSIDANTGMLSFKNKLQDFGKLMDEFMGVVNTLKTPSYVIDPVAATQITLLRTKFATLFSTGFVPPPPTPPEPELPEETKDKPKV